MFKKHNLFVIFLVLLIPLMSACGSSSSSSSSSAPTSFTIAYQPGLFAANLVVLKQQKTLEKQFPQTDFQWKVVNSGASVRDAMIANQAQLGNLGLPPFLVGWDHSFDWKVLIATNRGDLWLVAKDPRLKSLKDFTSNDKIGVVAPDSQQAILLRKAAQDQLGNAHALDKNMVSISSADGEQALLDGQLAAQYSGAPFQEQEVADGAHIVLHSNDAFGPVGTGLVVMRQSFYNQYPDFSKKLYQDIFAATEFTKTHHAQTAQYLSQDQGGGDTPAQFQALLDNPGFVFDTTPSGLLSYATFMKSIGLISKVPGSVKDLELPTVYGIGS